MKHNKTKPPALMDYLNSIGVFTSIYILGIAVITFVSMRFGMNISGLKITLILAAACGASLSFIKRVDRVPNKKESLILSTGSVIIFLLVILALNHQAGLPFMPVIILMQIITATAVCFMTYGWIARKYLAIPKAASKMKCLNCGHNRLKPLMLLSGRGIPYGEEGHSYVYDYEDISICNKCGHSQMEHYSYDSWSIEEPKNMYWWYVFDSSSTKIIKALLKDCPEPRNRDCHCIAHMSLREAMKARFVQLGYSPFPDLLGEYAKVKLEIVGSKVVVCNVEKVKTTPVS